MAEEKDKKNEAPASWYGISAGIIVFILIVAISLLWPESKPPKTAGATMAATTKSLTIMWGEHQIIDVSANNWSTSYNIEGMDNELFNY